MTSQPALSRNDRHVLQLRLRVGPDAPRRTLAFNIEEALRLCSLPGEDEGRVYHFRYLHLAGLPENGDRRIWLEAFQRVLNELATQSLHGNQVAALTANAVFFFSRQEACESLLNLVRRKQPVDAWYWPLVVAAPPGSPPEMLAAGAIASLSRSEASWYAVAEALVDGPDPAALLSLLPEPQIRHWLDELGSNESPFRSSAPIVFPDRTRKIIARVSIAFGKDNPRVLWLAALAVILDSPAELDRGTAVRRARSSLRALPEAIPASPVDVVTPSEAASPIDRSVDAQPLAALLSTSQRHTASDPACPATPAQPNPVEEPDVPAPRSLFPDDAVTYAPRCIGESTRGAGLYFLLNALRQLNPTGRRFEPLFLAHFFQFMAKEAAIAGGDPILLWAHLTLEDHPDYRVNRPLLRRWTNRVRRWCWKNSGMRISEIINRPGAVTVTRTDLDVALPLDWVDIRIRRIGLDLDPGWVPWFGRVVRFHYRHRGEFS